MFEDLFSLVVLGMGVFSFIAGLVFSVTGAGYSSRAHTHRKAGRWERWMLCCSRARTRANASLLLGGVLFLTLMPLGEGAVIGYFVLYGIPLTLAMVTLVRVDAGLSAWRGYEVDGVTQNATHCYACGYALDGLDESSRCPECGSQRPRPRKQHAGHDRRQAGNE